VGKFLRIVNGVARMVNESSSTPIYEQELVIGSTVSSGSPVTIPNSETYTDLDLEVYLGGQRMDPGSDYQYVSTPPRTQVTFTFDLVAGDIIIFRKTRNA
jgi:hypothetical protein